MSERRTRLAVEGGPAPLAEPKAGRAERPTPAVRGERPRQARARPRAVEARGKSQPNPEPTPADQEAAGEGQPAKKRRRGKLCLGNIAAGARALADAAATLRGAQPASRGSRGRELLAERLASGRKVNYQLRLFECGSPGCCCHQGGDSRHGPYRVAEWRSGAKVHSVYLGKVREDNSPILHSVGTQ